MLLQHFTNDGSYQHNTADPDAEGSGQSWRNAVQNLYDSSCLGDSFDARIQELLGVGFELLNVLIDAF